MHRRFLIIFAAFWLCVLVYAVGLVRKSSVTASKPAVATAALEPVNEEVHQKELADYQKSAQGQLEGMARLEVRRDLRDDTARQTYEARSQLQRARAATWSLVLSTNRQAFDVLRHKCEGSHSGETPCTICLGNGVMAFCVLCENTGKCPGCGGSGRDYFSKICPTCMGDGKCYLCSGSGRMMCLYCDDGTISRKGPLPLARLPVRCEPRAAREIASAQPYGSPAGSPLHRVNPSTAQAPRAVPPLAATDHSGLLLALILMVGSGLALLKIVVLLNKRADPWATTAAAAAEFALKLRTEEEVLSEFVQTFKTGPTGLPTSSPFIAISAAAERTQVTEFFERVPEILGALHKVLQRINATTDESARRVLLTDLYGELRILKDAASHPELLPVWQVAAALEGLVKQLTDRTGYLTPSTIRTVAGAVDFLNELCVPGVRADLFTNPPIRLLAVDDDPICRKVVAFSLKKALNQPDLAEDGETALALASQQAYDVIFLDVMMPGIDGYEVCKRIHETIPNATTPVVFVTMCGDFEGRAKAVVSGGCHLIAKPFLTFEITVKALTYARRAASSRSDRLALRPARNGSTADSPDLARTSPAQHSVPEASEDFAEDTLPEIQTNGHRHSELFVGAASSLSIGPA